MILIALYGALFPILCLSLAVFMGSFVMGPSGKHSDGFKTVKYWVEYFDAQHEHNGRHWAVA